MDEFRYPHPTLLLHTPSVTGNLRDVEGNWRPAYYRATVVYVDGAMVKNKLRVIKPEERKVTSKRRRRFRL